MAAPWFSSVRRHWPPLDGAVPAGKIPRMSVTITLKRITKTTAPAGRPLVAARTDTAA